MFIKHLGILALMFLALGGVASATTLDLADTLDPMELEAGDGLSDVQLDLGLGRDVPIFSADGKTSGVLAVGAEVTVSVPTEKLLRRMNSRSLDPRDLRELVSVNAAGLTPVQVWSKQKGLEIGDTVYVDLAAVVQDGEIRLAGVDTDSEEVQNLWSSDEDLADLPLVQMSTPVIAGAAAGGGKSLEDRIKAYSKSSGVKKAIAHGLKKKKRKSISKCWAYVKNALVAGKLTSRRLTTGSAIKAMQELPPYGFKNLLADKTWNEKIRGPLDAPIGSVLVYRGGCKHSHGHAEIRHSGGYVSDYSSARTVVPPYERKGRCHTLVGVFVKI